MAGDFAHAVTPIIRPRGQRAGTLAYTWERHRSARCPPYCPSKRADREISQPKLGKTAGLPDAEQRPVDGEAQGVVAVLDGDPDALAEIAAFDERPARKGAATGRTCAIEPERQCKAITEQEIHLAAPQRFASRFRIGISARIR